MTGRIVCSKAGRDKGRFMVAVREENGFVFVCDGKERPLQRPKRKNVKHIAFTNTVLPENSYKTNKSLKKALTAYRERGEIKEETQCRKRI